LFFALSRWLEQHVGKRQQLRAMGGRLPGVSNLFHESEKTQSELQMKSF
jgi:hypothetical protein